jgi:hypothetical protein
MRLDMVSWVNNRAMHHGTSFIKPNITFGLDANRPASVPQKVANWAVVAAVKSAVFPIILPVVGCWEGLLYLNWKSVTDLQDFLHVYRGSRSGDEEHACSLGLGARVFLLMSAYRM